MEDHAKTDSESALVRWKVRADLWKRNDCILLLSVERFTVRDALQLSPQSYLHPMLLMIKNHVVLRSGSKLEEWVVLNIHYVVNLLPLLACLPSGLEMGVLDLLSPVLTHLNFIVSAEFIVLVEAVAAAGVVEEAPILLNGARQD